MYRLLALLFTIVVITIRLNAQISEGGLPLSTGIPALKTTVMLPGITLEMPETDVTKGYQPIQEIVPARYGIFTDTLINLKKQGKTDLIAGKGKIWRLKISCPEALSVQVVFSDFIVPPDARLFLYDESMKSIAGAFTRNNSRNDSTFTIADFSGNHVILEYFEPLDPQFEGKLIIGAIGQAFTEPVFSEAGPGFININCPVGKIAQMAKHAVCKMSFRSGDYQVTCTGALINNGENDGTPYFLTANHCLSTQAEATSLVTYFNYENTGCNGVLQTSPTLSGSTILVTGQPSDFTLLELNDVPPPEYQPFYGGWNINNNGFDSVMGIHVPYNETKKISLDYDSIYSNPVSVTWDDDSRSPIGSHWVIGFDDGGTSQGSSGSPLFNSSNQIIGQLHGGDDIMAYYGKLSYSFAYKAPGYHTLKHYLDPDSSGIESLNGYAPADNYPDAFFTTKFDEVCHNTPILFTDYSVFGPYQRQWTITPASYSFSGGTTDSSPNPIIEFNQDTTYSVTLGLLIEDELYSSENQQIISGNRIDISVTSDAESALCDCDFDEIELTAQGGDQFEWSIQPGDENKIAISTPTGVKTTVLRMPLFESDSSYTIGLRVIGYQASCSDTVEVSYDLLRQINDNIENAIELDYGISDYYSNICAGIEDGEPIPPFISCTTQNSWCDEYGTGNDIVENSVWFKFIASPTGRVSISSTGMDNEIALYEADSYQAILAGDYTLLGANDDRSDADYRPLIINEIVHAGNTYWIQVDGSGGGLEDDFYMTITELTATGTDIPVVKRMTAYPLPASDRIYLYHPDWEGGIKAEISVFNPAGILVSSSAVTVDSGTITLGLSELQAGVYIASVKTGNSRFVAQIVKR